MAGPSVRNSAQRSPLRSRKSGSQTQTRSTKANSRTLMLSPRKRFLCGRLFSRTSEIPCVTRRCLVCRFPKALRSSSLREAQGPHCLRFLVPRSCTARSAARSSTPRHGTLRISRHSGPTGGSWKTRMGSWFSIPEQDPRWHLGLAQESVSVKGWHTCRFEMS